jgi:hypothetical protein
MWRSSESLESNENEKRILELHYPKNFRNFAKKKPGKRYRAFNNLMNAERKQYRY